MMNEDETLFNQLVDQCKLEMNACGSGWTWVKLFACVSRAVVHALHQEGDLVSDLTEEINKDASLETRMLQIAWRSVVMLWKLHEMGEDQKDPLTKMQEADMESKVSNNLIAPSLLQAMIKDRSGIELLHMMLHKEWKHTWFHASEHCTEQGALPGVHAITNTPLYRLLHQHAQDFKYPKQSWVLASISVQRCLEEDITVHEWGKVIVLVFDQARELVRKGELQFQSDVHSQQVMKEVILCVLQTLIILVPLPPFQAEAIVGGASELIDAYWQYEKTRPEYQRHKTDYTNPCCVIS